MIPALDDRLLDDDHAELQRLVAILADCSFDECGAALDALLAHALQHFETEDRDLRRMKGGNAECHIDEHAAVLASLEGVRRLLDDPERDRGTRMRIVSGLVAELQRWLPVHVGEMDRALAAHRFRERTGGALLRLAPRT